MAGNFWKSSHYKHWLLNEQLLSIGSAKDCKKFNLTLDKYMHVLNFYTDFIQAIGEALRVRQQVIACATVYFRRFYSKYSLECIDPLLLSPTCILLASKVEEHGGVSNTRLPAVCTQVLKQSRFSSVLGTSEYPFESRHILECEFYLVEVMDCCLIVYHPYRNLLELVNSAISHYIRVKQDSSGQMNSQINLKMSMDSHDSLISSLNEEQKQLEKLVFASAWAFINDCLRSDVILLYPPYKIALAALITSAATHRINIDSWLEQLNVDLSAIFIIIRTVLSIRRHIPIDEMMAIMAKVPKPVQFEIRDDNMQMQQNAVNLIHPLDNASRQQTIIMMHHHPNQIISNLHQEYQRM